MKNKLHSICVIASLLFLFYIIPAIADDPSVIAILDSPVDYEHSQISAALDKELLQKLKFTDANGNEKTWYDLNNEILAKFKARLNNDEYQEQTDFIEASSLLAANKIVTLPMAQQENIENILSNGIPKYLHSKKWKAELD